MGHDLNGYLRQQIFDPKREYCLSYKIFFMDIFEGLYTKFDLAFYPNQVFFFKGEDCCMGYDLENGWLWCRYEGFWKFLERENNLSYDEVQALIKKQGEDYFGVKGVTPFILSPICWRVVEKRFKLKVIN